MLFTILIIIAASMLLLGLFITLSYMDPGYFAGILLLSAFPALPPALAWVNHADDLATVAHQEQAIMIYQERVDSLHERLDSFEYPRGALLNNDSPVAAIVASLTEADEQLVRAKEAKVTALKSIHSRTIGPMGGVVEWVVE